MPFFPETSGDLPATRFLLFADQGDLVRVLDEGKLQKKGISFTAHWISPSLNRGDPFKEYTLRRLLFFYDAQAATTITVRASGDGGLTWNESKSVVVEEGDGKIAVVGFNTTGRDLRMQFLFDTDVVVNITGYKYKAVERSDIKPGG